MKEYAIEKDKEQCEKLWKKYIPTEEKLSENWEYNLLFHDSKTHDLFFLYEDNFFFPLVQEKTTKSISCFPYKRYQHIIL